MHIPGPYSIHPSIQFRVAGRQADNHPYPNLHLWPTKKQPNVHVFGLWEGDGVPRENPHKYRENMQNVHAVR